MYSKRIEEHKIKVLERTREILENEILLMFVYRYRAVTMAKIWLIKNFQGKFCADLQACFLVNRLVWIHDDLSLNLHKN